MRKIINRPETMVAEMCAGIAAAEPTLAFDRKYKIIWKKEINKNKVTLISGGGSGHEPAHAGYVGKGMLDAAVCGDVFASPSQIQVYQAIKKASGEKGTLLIIKNYSGDIMNFKNGANLAEEDGIKTEYVKVDDDIAVQDSLYTVGRRGVAGTVFVHKIAGAAAEKGMDLQEVKKVAEEANRNIKSIGFALSSCTVPAKGSPTFSMEENEMEYGVGIHGEPGIERQKIQTADELAERMTDAITKELALKEGEEITVLVNGFGATPLQELYVLNNAVFRAMAKRKIRTYRSFVGNFMTSIDMAGASLSVMKLNPQLKELLDFESTAPAFKVSGPAACTEFIDYAEKSEESKEINFAMCTDEKYSIIKGNEISLDNIVYLIDKMSDSIIKNEIPFCELDAHAGDGDFGMSVAKGFKQLKREWQDILEQEKTTIGSFLNACSLVIMEYCGGASGPIWGSAFRGAAKNAGDKTNLTVGEFAAMMQAAVKAIQLTGERSFGRGAVVGDKTLIDALAPSADAWEKSAKNGADVMMAFHEAAKAAREGAKQTEAIVARMGRAGTVGERSLGYPDAGAYALGVIFTELANSLHREEK